MASSLICPGQIKSGPTGWLPACLSVMSWCLSVGLADDGQQSQLAALSLVADNRTAPGDAFTLEKARAPTFQTRALWGGWVRTYVVAGAVSWVLGFGLGCLSCGAGDKVARVRLYLGTYLPSKQAGMAAEGAGVST